MFLGLFLLATAAWASLGPAAALATPNPAVTKPVITRPVATRPIVTRPIVTRPIVTSLGPDFPKTAIFIGNSFFYYNNGIPGHVSLLEKAADPDHKQDYRAA